MISARKQRPERQAVVSLFVLLCYLTEPQLIARSATYSSKHPAVHCTPGPLVTGTPQRPSQTTAGSNPSATAVITVNGYTNAAVQAAIDAAPASGARIILPAGEYVFTSHITIQNKANLTLEGYGSATFRSTSINSFCTLFGQLTNLRITGINWNNQRNGDGGSGLIASYEITTINGLTIDHCTFTAPACNINGIKLNTQSGTRGNYQKNIRIEQNTFYSIGRMGIELQNHIWEIAGRSEYYFDNVTIADNDFANLGTADGNGYGMAVSLSGLGQNMVIANNEVVDAKRIAYELVGGRYVSITGNVARSVNNLFVGIGVSDNDHNVTEQLTIMGNALNVKERGIYMYGAKNCLVANNVMFSDMNNDFKVSNSTFIGNTFDVMAYNGLIFDFGSTNNLIESNNISTASFSNGGTLVRFTGTGTTRNVLKTNLYLKSFGRITTGYAEQINGAIDNSLTEG